MSNGGLLLPIIAALAGMGLLIFFLVAVAIFLWYRNRKKRIMLEQLRPWPPANVSHQPGSPTGHALLLGSPEGSLLPPILKPISEVPDSATCPSTSNSAQNAYQREVYVWVFSYHSAAETSGMHLWGGQSIFLKYLSPATGKWYDYFYPVCLFVCLYAYFFFTMFVRKIQLWRTCVTQTIICMYLVGDV